MKNLLRDIIIEETVKLLNEIENRSFNAKTINLQYEFNKLNKILFNNEIPEIPVKWSRSKNVLGRTSLNYNKITNKIAGISIQLSNFYKLTYQDFLNILVHEMIHIYLILKAKDSKEKLRYIISHPHGKEFQDLLNKINNRGLGFNVHTKTNKSSVNVNNNITNKRDLIAIVFDIDGKYYITVITPNIYNRDFQKIINIFEYSVEKGRHNRVEINAIKTNNPNLQKFTIRRSFERKLTYSKINDELLEELLNDDIIKTVIIEKGKKTMISENITII